MPAEAPPPPARTGGSWDWRAALALVWAVAFGLLYARTVAAARLPGLLRFFPW